MTAQDTGVLKLHGKDYRTVALRVQLFRDKHSISDGWSIRTEILHADADLVRFRAVIIDPQGREVANGFAEEKRSSKGINATSALENCETSAIGRALAAAGFGGSEYASADEVTRAVSQQRELEQAAQGQAAPAPAGEVVTETATPAPAGGRHPSWTVDHKVFIAEVEKLGLTFTDVAHHCEGQGWGRPPTWTTAERQSFLGDLRKGNLPDLYKPAGSSSTEEEAPGEGLDHGNGHHDSWPAARKKFCAQLGDLDLRYEDVAAWCEMHGRLRPSQMSDGTRALLLRHLHDGEAREMVLWLDARQAKGLT